MLPSRTVRLFLLLLLTAGLLPAGPPAWAQRPDPAPDGGGASMSEPLEFAGAGHTFHGDWTARVVLDRASWGPGSTIAVNLVLGFADTHLASLSAAGIKADKLCVLMTAERTFDADGWMRLPSDERMSTLLTPDGPRRSRAACRAPYTDRYGYQFRSPVDQFVSLATTAARARRRDRRLVRRRSRSAPRCRPTLPPGLYRLRFDFGVMVGTRVYNFNGYTFAARPFSERGRHHARTSTRRSSRRAAPHVSGRIVDGARHPAARSPGCCSHNYNSNGYRGVVADEDAHAVRHVRPQPDPRRRDPADVRRRREPARRTRSNRSSRPTRSTRCQNIAWDWASGELSVQIAGPDGSVVDLGDGRFVAKGEQRARPRSRPRSPPGSRRPTAATPSRPPAGSPTRRAGGTRAAAPTTSGSRSA